MTPDEFKKYYNTDLEYIFNNYIKLFITDNNLPIRDMKEFYYDIIKYFYLNST